MAAQTEERLVNRVGSELFPTHMYRKIGANVKIWKGALVANAAGYAIPFTTAATHKVFGVADETVDNTGGSAGAKNVRIVRGVFPFVNSSAGDAIAQADVGKLCYGVDDQTVALTDGSGTRSSVGVIEGFDGALVLVRVGDGALADILGSGGAAQIDLLDAAGVLAATNLEDATAELAVEPAAGANLTDASATLNPTAGVRLTWRKLPAATLTQDRTLTLGTTGAVAGMRVKITRLDVTGFAYTIANGGAGAGTLCVLPGGAQASVEAQFDGTNWALKGAGSLGDDWVVGTALTDTAATTVQRGGRRTSFLLAGTMSQGETITLGTTGAQKGDEIRIIRTSTSAQTAAIVNGGGGGGTLVTLPASKVNFAEAMFDGTNWLFQACGSQ